MARQPRFFVPGEVLHVIQRGNNREPTFAAEGDYRFSLDCLVQASRLYGVLIHAYVLMTNRLHVLATPRQKDSLSKMLQSVGRRCLVPEGLNPRVLLGIVGPLGRLVGTSNPRVGGSIPSRRTKKASSFEAAEKVVRNCTRSLGVARRSSVLISTMD